MVDPTMPLRVGAFGDVKAPTPADLVAVASGRSYLDDRVPPAIADLMTRISTAAATSHVLVIARHGQGVTMAVRRIARQWPGADGFAARWVRGLIQWWTQGGLAAIADNRDRAKYGAAPQPWAPRQWTDGAPFRAPHHTVSPAGLLGGGNPARPGEATLAHGGILFLDELTEFSRAALEGLREPMDTGAIQIVRARYTMTLPARSRVIAAVTPCPCGFAGHPTRACVDSPATVERHRARWAAFASRDNVVVVDATTSRLDQPRSHDDYVSQPDVAALIGGAS